jgi:hypothetical protein
MTLRKGTYERALTALEGMRELRYVGISNLGVKLGADVKHGTSSSRVENQAREISSSNQNPEFVVTLNESKRSRSPSNE